MSNWHNNNHMPADGSKIEYCLNSNTSNVDVFLCGKLLGTKDSWRDIKIWRYLAIAYLKKIKRVDKNLCIAMLENN